MHNQSFLGRGQPAPSLPATGLGSAVGSTSGVQDGAPAAKRFYHIWSTQEDLSWHFSGVIVTEDRTLQECSWLLPKSLILDPSHCLIHFSIAQNKTVPHFQLILHASRV